VQPTTNKLPGIKLGGFFCGERELPKLFSGFMVVLLVCGPGATSALAAGKWQQVENRRGGAVWNANPKPNEAVTWTGECVNGRADGTGNQTWRFSKDGQWRESHYKGAMRKGKSNGHGVYVSASGAKYEGGWKDGKNHGIGIYMWANGNGNKGKWKEGKLTGRPSLFLASGDRYRGGWKKGEPHGRGISLGKRGSKYEGDWKDGKKHGRGTYLVPVHELVFASGWKYGK